MDILDLSTCKTNEEVSLAVQERVKSVALDKLISNLNKDFIYHEEATRKIYAALATNKNAILFGPGGFGKSVLVKAICKELGLPVIYKIGYDGMNPEELLGVPNMQKLLNESTYEVAFENSVFSRPGILILEEFFDTSAATAAALKDILTEKGFREGNTKKESLVATVIITGNKTPDSVSIDDSTIAFYKERFPMRHKMVWKSFEESDYLKFFGAYYKNKYNSNFNNFRLLSKLCSNTSTIVSPRVASQAADVMLELGISYIDTVEGIDTTEITRYKQETDKEQKLYEEKDIIENYKCYLKSFNLIQTSMSSTLTDRVKLDVLEERLNLFKFSEENMQEVLNIFSTINYLRDMHSSYLRTLVDTDNIYIEVDKLNKNESNKDT